MGVSFKVAKTGTRYRRKLFPAEANGSDGNDSASDSQQRDIVLYSTGMGAKFADPSSVSVSSQPHSVSDDLEASFSLQLFQNGFSVGKATELLNDIPVHLHPYDRASEKLFSAIECGWLPGDIFDGLPCKYVNGAILCEIQDYRGCLMQGRAVDYAKRSPTVHKILLRMRMENVIKDVVSISNDSWTYGDFLEVESRVLKALQPDLHLSPQPLQDIYSAEPISKKVDLGIMWSWKNRKLSNASDTALDFRNPYHLTGTPVNCATHSGSCLSGQSNQARGVTFLEHNASTSAAAPQETNVVLEKSLPNPLSSEPIPNIAESCTQSALKVKTTSNLVSLPKPSCNDSNNDFSKPSSLVLDKRVRCGIQAVQRPLLKKPKLEPVDSSYVQITGSQTENSLQPHLQWKNKLLHQKIHDGKVPHDRFQEKVLPLLAVNNVPTRSGLHAGMAAPNVKSEPGTYNYCGSNVLQSQKQQSKQKTNPCPKRSRKKTAGSSSSLSYANAANANNISKNLAFSQPSEDSELKLDLSRFLKIQAATERYGLNNRKCKLDPILQKKPSFFSTPLVSYHLLASKENGKWENTSTDKNSITECSMNWGLGVCRTRTLTFLRQSHICQENETLGDVREAQVRLVISEKRDEALVEARVLYGTGKECFSMDYPLMPSFTSTSTANLLATQFARVMKREGYSLSSFQVEPKPLNAVGGLSTPARTTELHSSTPTPGLSRSRLSPMQLQSHNNFSGRQWFQADNLQPAVQIPNSLISKLPLTVPTQANYLMPQVQQILNRQASLQYQILQRRNQLNESVQRSSELGGLGASASGGVQGHGSSGLGSFANVMGMKSSSPPMSLGGRRPWVGNVHVGQLNDSKLLGPMSEHSAGVWSRMREAEGRGTRTLMSGGQTTRNPIHGVPVGVSNIPADMARNLSNQQQLLQWQMHPMEMRSPVQQEMASLLQHPGGASLLQHVAGSPQTQSHQAAGFHQQLDQQPQLSQPATEPKPESLQQVKEMLGYGSPEMSSQQTYGSVPVGSSKT